MSIAPSVVYVQWVIYCESIEPACIYFKLLNLWTGHCKVPNHLPPSQIFGKLVDPENLNSSVLEPLGPEITLMVRDGLGSILMWNPNNPTGVYNFLLAQVILAQVIDEF